MERRTVHSKKKKRIALVAHDGRKQDLIEWAEFNKLTLSQHVLFGTGNTGRLLHELLGLEVKSYQSGPLGGDQEIGAKIVEGDIDFLIFFWDPMTPHPHDPDVKALLRIAVLFNIPVACNRATADFLISSHLMKEDYDRFINDYAGVIQK